MGFKYWYLGSNTNDWVYATTRDGTIVEAAPSLKGFIGQSLHGLLLWKPGYTLTEVKFPLAGTRNFTGRWR